MQHALKGVFLFFIISGFVLALPFARVAVAGGEPVSLRRYALRRLTRLGPPYLICLTLVLSIKFAGRALHMTVGTEGTGYLVERYLASAVYLHNLIYGLASAILGVAWSLEIEVQLSLLVPVLALVILIRSAPFAERS